MGKRGGDEEENGGSEAAPDGGGGGAAPPPPPPPRVCSRTYAVSTVTTVGWSFGESRMRRSRP
jgi:hypothetical protein